MTAQELAACTELAWFAPEATRADIQQLCASARAHSINAVCVNGSRVGLAYSLLEDSNVHVVALVGFPLGAADADVLRYETETAVDQGAHEIDFVLNAGRLKDGDHKQLLRELCDIVEAADERDVKLVLESRLLTSDQILAAIGLASEAGVKFLVAGTGFNGATASVDDARLLRENSGPEMGVKAAAGVGNIQLACALLEAGATRIGVIAGIKPPAG